MPRAALGSNLLHAGLKYVLVAVIHHQGQRADLVSRNIAKLGVAVIDRNRLGVMGIIALGTQRQLIADLKIAQDQSAVGILKSCDVKRQKNT